MSHNDLSLRRCQPPIEQCEALRGLAMWVEGGVGAFRRPSRLEPWSRRLSAAERKLFVRRRFGLYIIIPVHFLYFLYTSSLSDSYKEQICLNCCK